MHRREFLQAAVVAPLVPLASHSALLATDPAAERVLQVPIVGRKAWGAMPARSGMERHHPVRLTLHHQGTYVTRSAGEATMRGIQRYHIVNLGHPDVDYHFLIDRAGHIYQGRNPRFRGDTQTTYDPSGHFLVCCMGDYQGLGRPAQEPTPPMLRSLVALFAWASQKWSIDPGTIAGHRDYADTECPGRELYRLIRNGTLEQRVDRLVRNRTVQRVPSV